MCVLLLQGCSIMISKERELRRTEIYSKAKIGATRSEMIKVLGKPFRSEGGNVDYFRVSFPKSSDPIFHTVMDIAFLGFWELVATPYELASGPEYKAIWAVTYDKNDIVVSIVNTSLPEIPHSGK